MTGGDDDGNEHRERLAKLKRLLPAYAEKRMLEAVAAMVIPDEVATNAMHQASFPIGQSGEQLVNLNDPSLQPKGW